MNMIKTEKLTFEYIRRDEEGNVEGITRAVDQVDLDVEKGDFIAILGHNGSGKSTLAKHMNAIFFPTEGTIYVGGMDTGDESHIWDIRKTAGRSSVFPLQESLPCIRSVLCWMSLPPCWTPRGARRSSGLCGP